MSTPDMRDDTVIGFVRKIAGPGLLAPGLLLASLLPGVPGGSSHLDAQSAVSCPSSSGLTAGMAGAMAHVRYLADDALEGREAGSRGARCAADYIAGYFRGLGLEGAAGDGSFFQRFEMRMGSHLGNGNRLAVGGDLLTLGQVWIPLGFSASETVTGPLVYGGSGVSQPGASDVPFAGMDFTGKIVVVEGADPNDASEGPTTGTPHYRATMAAARGAAAVLILLPDGSALPEPEADRFPVVRIPVAAIAAGSAPEVRAAAERGAEGALTTALEPRMVEIRNVAALLPGSDPALAREVVVVGAHYDHLGFGGDGSLEPDSRAVHNGADDNASGTAALLEVARELAQENARPARSVLFLAFTGEEKGLWGSGHYVEEPLLPLESTVAMLNMDMVGRLRENTLTVYGTGSAREWSDLLGAVNTVQPQPFVLNSIPDGYGPSDQAEFYGAGIPVLHFFTNTHGDYHRPSDDWELIDGPGLQRIADMVEDLTLELAGTPAEPPPTLTLVEGAPPAHGAAMPSDSTAAPSRGYGPWLGTIPDMTPQELGVRITGVSEGSPAEKAGLQGGDILVEMDGTELTDLYAYTYALRAHEPGDEVTIVVLRDGQRVTLKAVLGRR